MPVDEVSCLAPIRLEDGAWRGKLNPECEDATVASGVSAVGADPGSVDEISFDTFKCHILSMNSIPKNKNVECLRDEELFDAESED